jgi:protein-tyrosine-phosphatase
MAKRVLFLCTGNSARSQIAEALMRHLFKDHFEVSSAGTERRPEVNPRALATLARHQVPADGLRPKDVASFAGQSFAYVITVCDRAREHCPILPGAEMIHWSFSDPAAEPEDRQDRAFEDVFVGLERRIRLLDAVESR